MIWHPLSYLCNKEEYDILCPIPGTSSDMTSFVLSLEQGVIWHPLSYPWNKEWYDIICLIPGKRSDMTSFVLSLEQGVIWHPLSYRSLEQEVIWHPLSYPWNKEWYDILCLIPGTRRDMASLVLSLEQGVIWHPLSYPWNKERYDILCPIPVSLLKEPQSLQAAKFWPISRDLKGTASHSLNVSITGYKITFLPTPSFMGAPKNLQLRPFIKKNSELIPFIHPMCFNKLCMLKLL